MTMGRHEEALARMKNSQDLDPLSLIINVAVGWALYFAGRYEEAIQQLRRTIDLDPNYPSPIGFSAYCSEKLVAMNWLSLRVRRG